MEPLCEGLQLLLLLLNQPLSQRQLLSGFVRQDKRLFAGGLQLLNLPAPAEKIAGILKGAARHGAAGA